MKIMIVNGSPRKNWNTAQLLKEAQKGAESVNAEVEYINLYDLSYSGCRACLACKRKGLEEPCRCYWKDDLTSVLERAGEADRLIIGTPIYFGEPTGGVRSFLERMLFPALTYNDYSSIFKGKTDVDVFLTMNVPLPMYKDLYEQKMKDYFASFQMLKGEVSIYPVCDTLQVNDYSKYEMGAFSEEHKRAVHDTDFAESLKQAFKIGAGENR